MNMTLRVATSCRPQRRRMPPRHDATTQPFNASRPKHASLRVCLQMLPEGEGVIARRLLGGTSRRRAISHEAQSVHNVSRVVDGAS